MKEREIGEKVKGGKGVEERRRGCGGEREGNSGGGNKGRRGGTDRVEVMQTRVETSSSCL